MASERCRPSYAGREERMHELIAKLETAEAGARELDAEIAVAVRSTDTASGQLVPDWAYSNFPMWRARSDGRVEVVHTDGSGGLNWRPPAYTTSLDAKVPGEDIVKVERLPDGLYWATDARCDYAVARTETLARRAAALKALRIHGASH